MGRKRKALHDVNKAEIRKFPACSARVLLKLSVVYACKLRLLEHTSAYRVEIHWGAARVSLRSKKTGKSFFSYVDSNRNFHTLALLGNHMVPKIALVLLVFCVLLVLSVCRSTAL